MGKGNVLLLHPSDELYGSDRMLIHSARVLSACNELQVWLPKDQDYPQRRLSSALRADGIGVQFCDLPVLRRSRMTFLGSTRLATDSFKSLRLLLRHKAQWVYLNTSALLLLAPLAKLAGKTVILHQHEIWSSKERRALGPLLLFVDAIVAPSEAVRNSLPPAKRHKAHVVPNGLDIVPRQGRQQSRPLTFLLASRWSKGKGHVEFLAAWEVADLPDATLLILGGPPLTGGGVDIQALVAKMVNASSVDIVGEVSDSSQYIERSHVVVLPSTRPESFGLVAIEAMAQGKAVAATNLGGVSEILGSQTAWLLDPKLPTSWSGTLRSITAQEAIQKGVRGQAVYASRYTGSRYRTDLRDILVAVGMPV